MNGILETIKRFDVNHAIVYVIECGCLLPIPVISHLHTIHLNVCVPFCTLHRHIKRNNQERNTYTSCISDREVVLPGPGYTIIEP